MSDTPRTDALLKTADDSDVFVELARQLERELASDAKDAARYRFVCAHNPPGLRSALTDIANCKEDIDGIVDAAMEAQ